MNSYLFKPLFFLTLAVSSLWGISLVTRNLVDILPGTEVNAGTIFVVVLFFLLPVGLNAIFGFLIIYHYRFAIGVAVLFCYTIFAFSVGGNWSDLLWSASVIGLIAWTMILAAFYRDMVTGSSRKDL